MPIHLPPLSRRNFFKRSLLAGAGAALAPNLFATARTVDANSWALLSDLHIAGDLAKNARGINMADHLRTAAAGVLSLPQRPAATLILGDCAFNNGETEDYAALTSLLHPLRHDGLPVHLMLGNHDHRERFWAALEQTKAAPRPVTDRQVALVRSVAANWFMLDSLEKTVSTPGLLGEAQLQWLAESLDANAKKPAIVMVHHNPGHTENVSGLKDTDAFFEIIRPRKQVKAYMFGHTHKWRVTRDDSGIHLVNLPPVGYIFKEGDPAGWVHATLQRAGMKLELRCIDSTHENHGDVVALKWRDA